MLRHKTRVFVTNELSYLRHANMIIVIRGLFVYMKLFADGMISVEGSYNDLMRSGALNRLVEEREEDEAMMPNGDDISVDDVYFDDSDDVEYHLDDFASQSPIIDHVCEFAHTIR